jgi:hypothetical protein
MRLHQSLCQMDFTLDSVLPWLLEGNPDICLAGYQIFNILSNALQPPLHGRKSLIIVLFKLIN